jgi:hypothetical protein
MFNFIKSFFKNKPKKVTLIDRRYNEKKEYTYDKDGNILKCKFFYSSSAGSQHWHEETYNENGFVILKEYSRGEWTKYTYNDYKCVLTELYHNGYSIERTYDKFHKQSETVVDPNTKKKYVTTYNIVGDYYNTQVIELDLN